MSGFSQNLQYGTWVPVLTCGVPGDLTVAYSTQLGFWVKRDRNALLIFNIATSTFTRSTASGGVIISGNPFTSASLGQVHKGSLAWSGVTKASMTDACCNVNANASNITLQMMGSGQALAGVAITDMPSAGTVQLLGQIEILLP